MTEIRVTYGTAAGNAEPVAWVSVPRAQWDVQMQVTQALQERADKAEAAAEQWQRLVAFLRERLTKCQKHNRDMATWQRETAEVNRSTQRELGKEMFEVRSERDRNSKCYRELADVTDGLRARCAVAEQERDAARAALGRAVELLTKARDVYLPWYPHTHVAADWLEHSVEYQEIDAILADPTGQAAAERLRKLEALAVIARKHLCDDSNKAWSEFSEALDALDKGKEGKA